jgi:hypothetical protein
VVILVERLVALLRSNQRLSQELEALGLKLQRARAYAAQAGSTSRLATANLRHVKTKYSALLTQLRANRLEALELVDRGDHLPGAPGRGSRLEAARGLASALGFPESH